MQLVDIDMSFEGECRVVIGHLLVLMQIYTITI